MGTRKRTAAAATAKSKAAKTATAKAKAIDWRGKREPRYSLHKGTGQAVVYVDKTTLYLGKHDSPESLERFEDVRRAWLRANKDRVDGSLTVDVLALMYLDQHVSGHYRKNGRETSEVACIKAALRPLIATCGSVRVRDFGPARFRLVQDAMVRLGWCRPSVNRNVGRIRRMFKWAVANEHAPAEVWHGLLAVSGLQRERTPAPEPEPVQPVSLEDVLAIEPHVGRVVWGMVRFQLFTGCRPGEVRIVRWRDVDRSDQPGTGGVWTYRPGSHKTEHHGRDRVVMLGPKAQAVLGEFLSADPDRPIFPSPVGRDGRKPAPYTADSYRIAIARGCEVAFGMPGELRWVPSADDGGNDAAAAGGSRARRRRKLTSAERRELLARAREWRAEHCWSPNQLRHTAATLIRQRFGLEAAQVVLGHARADVTQIYAERDLEFARRVAADVG